MAKNSEAKIKANNKYDNKTYKRYTFRVRNDDKKLIKILESVPSVNGYITELIRKDIKASKN